MKITEVRTLILGVKIDEPISTSFGTMTHRYMILVNIRTDKGLEGWGESWSNFPAWSPHERIHTINSGLAPLLIGKDPRDVEALHQEMRKATYILERQWGAPGPIAQAISAVDIALWDIAARAREKSIHQLWDANTLPIPVYASALGPKDPTKLIEKMLQQGVTAFKLKLGFGKETDSYNLELVREMIGPYAQFMVDANQAWDIETALEMAKVLEPYNITWLEEPLPADQWQNMARLRKELPFKIAAGENIYNSTSFKDFLATDSIDIAQPDVCKVGGLSDMRTICSAALKQGIDFAPHYLGGAIGLLASLQLYAGTSGGLIMEMDPHSNPLREELAEGLLDIEDGCVKVPMGVGLGLELKEATLKKYLLNEAVTR